MTTPITLFDLPEPLASLYRPQLRLMHREHGVAGEGLTCAQCVNLRRYTYHNKHYYKCALYGVSNGQGTDWRRSWPACGAWQERTAG